MDYREYPVPAALAGVVDAIWTLEAPGTMPAPEAIVPDGRAEIVLHFGDAFERWRDARVEVQPAILVAGQIDRPLWLRPRGRVGMLGIRLAPAGARALLPLPASDLANETPALDDVAPRVAAWLECVRDAAATPAAAVPLVCRELPALVERDDMDRRVAHATALADRPGMTVDGMAQAVNVTRRQLERLFGVHVGLQPRALLRIRRLQRTLASLEVLATGGSSRPGADAAADGGYADQAHFVRECAALTGRTPSAHLLRQAALTGVFLGPSRRD